jgi:two-component system response regulator YesN
MNTETWQQHSSYQKAHQELEKSLPLLQQNLIYEMLTGKAVNSKEWNILSKLYEVSLQGGDTFTIVILRIEDDFVNYEDYRHPLLEFSILNIFREVTSDHYELLYCQDVHHDLLFFLKPTHLSNPEPQDRLMEQMVYVQDNIKKYLKGSVSILIGTSGLFPDDVHMIYHSMLAKFSSMAVNRKGWLHLMKDQQLPDKIRREGKLTSLYNQPTIHHFIENGWRLTND